VTELREFRRVDLPGLASLWNAVFTGGPGFVTVTEDDLARRVVDQLSFDPRNLLVACHSERPLGFVHFGPRTSLWSELRDRRPDPSEGHIYALAAPESDRPLLSSLLQSAVARLSEGGASRVLLGPSWIYGSQPFYNGIAGSYEIPGLSPRREALVGEAAAQGFSPLSHYGTPTLDLTDQGRLALLRDQLRLLRERARRWGLQERSLSLKTSFFFDRRAVALVSGGETVAMTAYGVWHEHFRETGRILYGITSVQVAEGWRGRGLGKLVMLLAMEAALKDGAHGLHLHVYRDNRIAWNLYHRALGFAAGPEWFTLEKHVS